MTKPSGPLAGITVLDLTSVLYGPYASQTLGDWGAEVIKIEPLTGDTWRYSGQFRNRGMTGQFMAVNRNKRSLALDLKQPDGKAVLQRLIATADVAADQYPSGGAWPDWVLAMKPASRSIPGWSMRPPPVSARTGRGPRAPPSTR